jgi:hypothetical protein
MTFVLKVLENIIQISMTGTQQESQQLLKMDGCSQERHTFPVRIDKAPKHIFPI